MANPESGSLPVLENTLLYRIYEKWEACGLDFSRKALTSDVSSFTFEETEI